MNQFLKLAYNHGAQQAIADLEKQSAFYDDMAALARKRYTDFLPTHSASRLSGPRRFFPQPTISESSLAREMLDGRSFDEKADLYIQALEAMGRGRMH